MSSLCPSINIATLRRIVNDKIAALMSIKSETDADNNEEVLSRYANTKDSASGSRVTQVYVYYYKGRWNHGVCRGTNQSK